MEDLNSWGWWRDKKGMKEALEVYYPDTLAAHPELQMALYSINAAEALIDQTMEKLAGEADDEP